MSSVFGRRRLFVAVLFCDLLLALALILAPRNPELVECVYHDGFFASLAPLAGWLSDLIPFSLHEALSILLILAALRGLLRLRRRWRESKEDRGRAVRDCLRRAFIALSCIVIAFYALWGFNYFRPRLVDSASFDKSLVTVERSRALLENCLDRLVLLERVPDLPADRLPALLQKSVTTAMPLAGDTPIKTAARIKYFLSGWLSLGMFGGVTLPLLPEAHISLELSDIEKPFIIAHEKIHLQGRALESEANYFALLACLASDEASIRRSGIFALFRLLLQAQPRNDRAYWISRLPQKYIHDLAAPGIRMRGKSRTLIALFRFFYGGFLEAQRISDGLGNYSAAAQLALGYRLRSGTTINICAQ